MKTIKKINSKLADASVIVLINKDFDEYRFELTLPSGAPRPHVGGTVLARDTTDAKARLLACYGDHELTELKRIAVKNRSKQP